jgi:hypothetical protein
MNQDWRFHIRAWPTAASCLFPWLSWRPDFATLFGVRQSPNCSALRKIGARCESGSLSGVLLVHNHQRIKNEMPGRGQ